MEGKTRDGFYAWGHQHNLTYEQLMERVTVPLDMEYYARMTPDQKIFNKAKKIFFPKYGFCIEISGREFSYDL